MSIRTHDRYPYSPISSRRSTTGPAASASPSTSGLTSSGFSFGEGWGRSWRRRTAAPTVFTTPGATTATVSVTFAWRKLFADLKLPVSLLVNAEEMYRHAPQAVAAFHDAEIIGHGPDKLRASWDPTEAEELALIAETTAAIEKHSGKRPQGWLGPWISQSSAHSRSSAGGRYRYLLDWCHERPARLDEDPPGRILSIPYPQELNDIPQIVARKREGSDFAEMIVDAFDVMHTKAESGPWSWVSPCTLTSSAGRTVQTSCTRPQAYCGQAGGRTCGSPRQAALRLTLNVSIRHDTLRSVVWRPASPVLALADARYLPLIEAAAHFPPRGVLIGIDLGTKRSALLGAIPIAGLQPVLRPSRGKNFSTTYSGCWRSPPSAQQSDSFWVSPSIWMEAKARARSRRELLRATLASLPICRSRCWDERRLPPLSSAN